MLRDRASKAVADTIDTLNKDAQARRRMIEQRVAELQSEVQTFPTRLQKLVDAQVATAGDTYADLVKRGESWSAGSAASSPPRTPRPPRRPR